MTKKIFAMFLAVLMVISLLPTSVFAAEKTCPGKGNHTPDNCNNTVVKVVDPTCSVRGYTRYKCNDCGEEFDGTFVKATGKHNYVATEDKAPTCEALGYKGAQKCTECGDVKAATTIPALNEGKYNCQWEIVNNATCTEGGTQEWKCSVCGATKTVKVEKGEHDWDNGKIVTAPTATANGLATRTCKKCGEVKEIIVFYSHDCKKDAILVSVAATCTTAGVKSHYECRVCGNWYKDNGNGVVGGKITKQDDKDEMTIPASHTFEKNGEPYTATCADTLLYCTVCKQWVNPGVEHDIDWKITDAEKTKDPTLVSVAATCTTPGYIYDLCKNCEERRLKTLPVLGHKEVTVTYAATCSTYAYSFTYCTRIGCTSTFTSETYVQAKADERYNFGVHSFVTSETAPVVNEDGYYFATEQKNVGTVLYFNGKMNGYYLDTTNNVNEAVKVYVEKIHVLDTKGEMLLYFYDAEGVKTYIEIYEHAANKVDVRLTTTRPSTGFIWNESAKVMATTLTLTNKTEETYYLGTYKDFSTISASKISDASTSFIASLVNVKTTAAANVIGFTWNKDAGMDKTNHGGTWTVLQIKTPATCTEAGVKVVACTFCGSTHEEEIAATHTWVNATDDQVPGKTEKAAKTVGCEDGWQWKICSACKETKKETYTGSGHVYGALVEAKPDHVNTSVYDTKTCKYCNDVQKLTLKVWEYAGKQFDSVTDAAKAHGGLSNLTNKKVLSTGDCTNNGLTQYTCSGCKKPVYVKTEGKHTMPENDANGEPNYQAPTCTEKGWIKTYVCTVCKNTVGAKAIGDKNYMDALGHNYEVDDDHECDDCDSPDFSDVHSTCTECGDKLYCFVGDEDDKVEVEKGSQLCDTTTYLYYYCRQCDDVHIRNYVAKMGHNMVAKEIKDGKPVLTKKPTCTEEGEYIVYCTICGAEDVAKVDKVAHKNKDNVEFWDKCGDTVEDRHCVNCCDCASKGSKHDCVNNKINGKVVPCDCVIGTNHTYKAVMMPSSCDMPPYLMKTCVDCGHIDNEIQTKVNGKDVVFSGHMPAEIDYIDEVDADGKLTGNKVPQKYKGFKYVDNYTYYWYTVENGQWVEHSKTYTAKFIECKDATYTEEGYDLMYCQVCKSEEKNTKEKLTGLGFQMTVTNANGAKGFTYGSLIEVTISANGNDVSFYGFEFNVESTVAGENAADALRFVGYEAVNPNFNVAVSNAATALANKKVNVVGYANNDASGKMQNISVNGKTDLVKLYFRVVADNAAEYTFGYTAPVVKKISNYTAQEVQNITANLTTVNAKVAKYMDFNNDGFVSTSDAFLAMTLITGEQPDGLTYNVSIDIDKDGEITLADLSALYEHLVGNKSVNDLFKMGIDADELTILGLGKKTVCNNSACKKEISADATYCPFCGNHQ